jgi:kynurenine formamidase
MNTLSTLIAEIQSRALEIVDLSHTLNTSTPLFDENDPQMVYKTLSTNDADGCQTGAFEMLEHFGTHIDAPAHFLPSITLDKLDVGKLILPAVTIDVRAEVEKDCDYRLTRERILAFEKSEKIPAGAAVLLLTGWGKRYHDATVYRNADAEGNCHFPGYGVDGAEYLVKERKAAALGIDTLSIDFGLSKDFAVHKLALAQEIFLIENLENLELLPERGAIIFCGPMKIEHGTGSPARIIALVTRNR